DLKELEDYIGTTQVDYASVLPGAGKTLWAIKKMRKVLEEKSEVIIYVAPTSNLLWEVKRALVKTLDKDLHDAITLVLTETSNSVAREIQLSLEGSNGRVDRYGNKFHKKV
ncbi:MAG: hypothetical protein K2X95_01495, partial [Flavobacteriaceae bacterium]|nr:hypothetical protein [Flavobacteriaceae bacterium]